MYYVVNCTVYPQLVRGLDASFEVVLTTVLDRMTSGDSAQSKAL